MRVHRLVFVLLGFPLPLSLAAQAPTLADEFLATLDEIGAGELPPALMTRDGTFVARSEDFLRDLASYPASGPTTDPILLAAARPATSGTGCAGVFGYLIDLVPIDDLRIVRGPPTGDLVCGRYPEHAGVFAELRDRDFPVYGALGADASSAGGGPATVSGFHSVKAVAPRGFVAAIPLGFHFEIYVFAFDSGAAVVSDEEIPQALCVEEADVMTLRDLVRCVG